MDVDLNLLIETYLRFQRDSLESDRWAWFEIDSLVREDPLESWKVVCALILSADTPEALAYVAAGPLEDWVDTYADSHFSLLDEKLMDGEESFLRAYTQIYLPRGKKASPELLQRRERVLEYLSNLKL